MSAGAARAAGVKPILVIGGGIAGQAVCEALRRREPEVPLVMVCGEPRLPYDRVTLSTLLASEGDPASQTAWPAMPPPITRIGLAPAGLAAPSLIALSARPCAPGRGPLGERLSCARNLR